MQASIIIPVFNGQGVIKECLESLSEQSFTDFEVIVVDDGSTDATSQMLCGASKTLPNFRFFEQKHLGAGAARNFGAGKAKGKILVFVDTDMTFDKNFLKTLIDQILKSRTKGTFSKDEYISNWENVWARCWNINEGWQEKRRHPKNYPDHQSVFRAILKSEFDKVHGFTPGGYDDDWSLSKKLGYKAVNAPGAVFYHKNPDSLTEVFNHAKWVAKRNYRFGFIGEAVVLIRSSFPFSIIIGLYKSFINAQPMFLVFKLVYDFGIFVGILEKIFS